MLPIVYEFGQEYIERSLYIETDNISIIQMVNKQSETMGVYLFTSLN